MAIKKRINKNIKYYLNLPWTYTVETEKDEKENLIYVIHVNELEGIATDAPTVEKAMKLIKEAMEAVFEMYLENDEEIPEPKIFEQYKGNIAYRTTPLRHYSLVKEAQKKNLSISQLIDNAIDSTLKKK
jgi:predicted RNase H-like HicB family nuclease